MGALLFSIIFLSLLVTLATIFTALPERYINALIRRLSQ